MQGKILIVDAIATNRIVLKVKLSSAYYQVLQASSVTEAMEIACRDQPDLVISALTLPDGDATTLCAALHANRLTENLPMMAIGSPADANLRLETLASGVQDVLLKPINDTLLLGRVRGLIRAFNATAEWRMRDFNNSAAGLAEAGADFGPMPLCMLVSSDNTTHAYARHLRPLLRAKLIHARTALAFREVEATAVPDAFVLILPPDPSESSAALSLISTLRANASTRHVGVLVLQTRPDAGIAANALDLGADDLMTDGFDAAELTLRLKALIKRKRLDAQLRDAVHTEAKAAVYDPLTGLHNRRYAMPDLRRIAERASVTGQSFAVMVADLDHFKRINDIYGHASGDAVLVEVANRLQAAMRSGDMVARIGGEEFMIVMPGTSLSDARKAALRICNDICVRPFKVPGHKQPIPVTISIGMAIGNANKEESNISIDGGKALLDQADKALYSAKMKGRNCVRLSRPAA